LIPLGKFGALRIGVQWGMWLLMHPICVVILFAWASGYSPILQTIETKAAFILGTNRVGKVGIVNSSIGDYLYGSSLQGIQVWNCRNSLWRIHMESAVAVVAMKYNFPNPFFIRNSVKRVIFQSFDNPISDFNIHPRSYPCRRDSVIKNFERNGDRLSSLNLESVWHLQPNPRPSILAQDQVVCSLDGFQVEIGKNSQDYGSGYGSAFQYDPSSFITVFYAALSLFGLIIGCYFYWQVHYCFKFSFGFLLFLSGVGFLIFGYGFYKMIQRVLNIVEQPEECCRAFFHNGDTVTQKLLTMPYFCNTLIAIGRSQMANVLSIDKQVQIISALAEGSGIRQIERMTGVHRDTIMRLGVRVGQGCAGLLDRKMRNLSCQHLQFDEIWGFIGKKERHCTVDDDPKLGDVWTFCAIDDETKLVPSFRVGKRDSYTANAFVADIASRMANRVQISSDALRAYVEAIELSFGNDVDFAQIIKTYEHDASIEPERKFSAPEVVITEKRRIVGRPNMRRATTSHVERLNGTTRLHMRRLTRLTYAFSKKRENFEAAVALHFAYYNFVKRHITLRATPAMAAGIERDFWSVSDLVEAAA
jgi:IS1 family transposase